MEATPPGLLADRRQVLAGFALRSRQNVDANPSSIQTSIVVAFHAT
jgi:hypothetical protein